MSRGRHAPSGREGESLVREKKRIDDDWKRRAAEEKAKIASQLEPSRPPAAAPRGAETGDAPSPEPAEDPAPTEAGEPDPTLLRLISTIGGQAMLALGMTEDPHTGQRYLDLDLARETVDMLGVIEERTRGNLSAEEARIIGEVLHQLRVTYTQRVQQAQQAAMNQPPPGADPGVGGRA